MAQVLVLVDRVRDAAVRLQDARVHREQSGAGHRAEVEGPVAVRVAFGQRQAEHAVVPLESNAPDVERGG